MSLLQLSINVNTDATVALYIKQRPKSLINRDNAIFQQIITTQYERQSDHTDIDTVIQYSKQNIQYTNTYEHRRAKTTHISPPKHMRRQLSDTTWDHKGYELLHSNTDNNADIDTENNDSTALSNTNTDTATSRTQRIPLTMTTQHKQPKTSLYKQLLTVQHEQKIQRSRSVPNQTHYEYNNDNEIYDNAYKSSQTTLPSAPKLPTRRLTYDRTYQPKQRIVILTINIAINSNEQVTFNVYNDRSIEQQCNEFCNSLNAPQKADALCKFVVNQLEGTTNS